MQEERMLIRHRRKQLGDPDAVIRYLCKAFNLSEDTIEPALLKEVIGRSIGGEGITSKELNRMFEIPRSTVIYHLNRFINTGLVTRKGRKYLLREEDLAGTIEEIEEDTLRHFNKLIELAEEFDKIAGEYYGRKEGRKRRKQQG